MSSKRERPDDVLDTTIPRQLISETVIMPPKIAVSQAIEVNDSSTEAVKTITTKVADITTYSTIIDATSPIIIPIGNTGDATFDGYPLLTDPKSLRVDFEVELADLDMQQWVPSGVAAPFLVEDGTFSDHNTLHSESLGGNWNAVGGSGATVPSISSETLKLSGGSTAIYDPPSVVSPYRAITTIVGETYIVTFDITSYTQRTSITAMDTFTFGAGIHHDDFSCYDSSYYNYSLTPALTTAGTVAFTFTATTTSTYLNFKFNPDAVDDVFIDNVYMNVHTTSSTELVVNGDFSHATNGWTLSDSGSGVAQISTNKLLLYVDTTADEGSAFSDTMAVTEGKFYKVTFTRSGDASTGNYFFYGVSGTATLNKFYSSLASLYQSSYSFTFLATATENVVIDFALNAGGATADTVNIDNVTMRELTLIEGETLESSTGWVSTTSSAALTTAHQILVGAGGGDSYTSTKLRLNRNLPTNMGQFLNASGATIGTDTPSNSQTNLYTAQGGDAYYPPSCSSYPTRLEPFEWIEISFPFSDNVKTIRIDDPAKIKAHFANIVKQKTRKINYESTKWNTKFKRIGTNALVPSEDLTYDKDPHRYASGEWFEDLAVGDKAVYTIYIADIAEEFNKDELMYLPNLQVTLMLKPNYRSLFVKHIAPVCSSVDSMPKIAYPHTLVPDISNANVMDLTYINDTTLILDSTSPTLNTVTGSYFNINGASCSYDTYYSKRIPVIPQFFNAFQRLSFNTKFVPAIHSGNILLLKDTHFGNPKGVFIFPEIDLTLEDLPSSVDTTVFFNRRWTESLPFQFKNVQLDVDGAKYPTDEIYKPYSMNTYSGIKREYLDMLRKAWDVTQSDLDMFDPHTERQLPLLYVPFDPVVRDMNKANENILSGSVNHNTQYDYHIEFSTTDALEWGSTHNTALRNTKFILAYVQDYSVTMYGNHVESTAH